MSFRRRNRRSRGGGKEARRRFRQRIVQIEDNLLDRVEDALQYHVEFDGGKVRENLLNFTTIDEAPSLVKRLQGAQPRSS